MYQNLRPFMRVLTETPLFGGLNDRHLTKTPLSQHHKKIPLSIEVRFQEIKITFMVATLSLYPQGCNLIFYIAPFKNTRSCDNRILATKNLTIYYLSK